ncbi:unnamed protein product [Dovyalis caffra]|uniref:Uncharacterized protein n=1 Tax=Dovyalis caffra TaxID=77055 RepID=A0AAV1QQ78_9ROSI|nr:unnamed protein product [Dovyalis caffra]
MIGEWIRKQCKEALSLDVVLPRSDGHSIRINYSTPSDPGSGITRSNITLVIDILPFDLAASHNIHHLIKQHRMLATI